MKEQYPKWVYKKNEEAKIVKSEDEYKALGVGWVESPALFDKEVKKDAVDEKSKAKTVKKISSKGKDKK